MPLLLKGIDDYTMESECQDLGKAVRTRLVLRPSVAVICLMYSVRMVELSGRPGGRAERGSTVVFWLSEPPRDGADAPEG